MSIAPTNLISTSPEPLSRSVSETPLTWMDCLAVLLLVGNLSLGRSFAHLGVAPFYIGEVSLAVFLLVRWRTLLATWMTALVRPHPLTVLVWLLLLSSLYGLLQLLRGIDANYDRMSALQTVTFHAYPLVLFLGLETGLRHPDLTPHLIRWLAWIHGLYGLVYMAAFRGQLVAPPVDLQPDETWLFGDPVGSAVCLLGLLALQQRGIKFWLPFLLNLSVLFALQVRAEMLGFAVAVLLWSFLAGRFLQLCGLVLLGGSALLMAAAADIRIASPGTRGGEISARTLVGKLVAPIDRKAAQALKRDADIDSDTVEWRTEWWRVLWRMVHQTEERTLFGPGYGFAIWELHPLWPLETKVRTPHNVFMYALAYTGWVGVLFFVALQGTLGWMLWRVYRIAGQPFGVCVWLLLLVKGTFENFFETPFQAIPFYLLMGLSLAPLLFREFAVASVAEPSGAAR